MAAQDQSFDTARWVAWLDRDADDSITSQIRSVLLSINQVLTGKETSFRAFFPMSVLRLPAQQQRFQP